MDKQTTTGAEGGKTVARSELGGGGVGLLFPTKCHHFNRLAGAALAAAEIRDQTRAGASERVNVLSPRRLNAGHYRSS